MPDQVLQLGHGKYMHVTRSFRDGGRDAEWAMVGGQRIRIADAVRALPEIFQNADGFFYKDGSPVVRTEDVAYLPEPYKTQAVKWIEKGKTKPVQIFEDKTEAVIAAANVKRRGRPSKQGPEKKKVININDEASFLEAGGVHV
jgi:hypothetical protein